MDVCLATSRAELGVLAARDIGTALRRALRRKPIVRMILAAAPSQGEMVSALAEEPGIDWSRVAAFHMDEYIDLPPNAPQRFGAWLQRSFFNLVPLSQAHLISPGPDPEATCREYAAQLALAPIDLVLLGIGANGHLAFNDPPANLNDPLAAKVVRLDAKCREQQVLDGCFARIQDVPETAITLTIPTILSGRELFCCVPGRHKSDAVWSMFHSPVSGTCPATVLRTHPRCTIYLDPDSNSLMEAND
jgi:glucosamine-6-phosphate deaminase